MVLAKLCIYLQKNEIRCIPSNPYKTQFKMWFKIHLKFEMLKLPKDRGGNILQVLHVSKTSGTGLQQPGEQVQEWTSWVTRNGTVSTQRRWLSAGSLQMGDSLCRSYLECTNNCKHETPQSCYPINGTSMPHLIPRLGNRCRRGTERLLVQGWWATRGGSVFQTQQDGWPEDSQQW